MMSNDVFIRDTESPYIFYCNRETGKWILAKSHVNEEKLKFLNESKIYPKVNFKGTRMVLLNISRECNLDCIYCHIGPKKSKKKMTLEVGKKAINRVFELPESDRTVIFHGSEPLTNFSLIKKLVNYASSNGKIKFGVQSNGTLFNNEIIGFFKENNIGVGISIDGLKKHQDKTRPLMNGRSSYETVTNNLSKLQKALRGISTISVVSKHNVEDLESIAINFEQHGISSIRFSPLYSNKTNEEELPSEDLLIKNVKNVFDRYIKNLSQNKKTIRITNFLDILRGLLMDKQTFNCTKCSGSDYHPLIAIDINGDIYPCDFFWGRKEYKVGNIQNMSLKDSFNSNKNFRVYQDINSLEDCVSCDWKRYCGAGCPGSHVMKGNGLVGKDPYCQYTKEMFEYVVKKLPSLKQRGLIKKILVNNHIRS